MHRLLRSPITRCEARDSHVRVVLQHLFISRSEMVQPDIQLRNRLAHIYR